MTQTPAPRSVHRVIAEQVRRYRKDRGWTAQRLGDELTQVGIRWDRSIVANFENGRRAYVTVEEFLALAYVLGVTPRELVVANEAQADEPYQATPEVEATVGGMREWFAGGFLIEPQNVAELAEAIRRLPSDRAGELNRRWWTPERMRENNRAVHAFLDEEAKQQAQADNSQGVPNAED